jgi:hypothetical protein
MVVMTAALGPSVVHPGNVDWLMRGDFSLHFLGWHLYRTGPWTLPLGATPLLIWPVGSSVGLTDSIPIAAFGFKLLGPVLPPVFQFIGLWLVSCFALQGVFGALLMQRATPRPSLQFLGALLFVLSPPLVFRFGHAALSAHWLLLAALWLCLADDADTPSHRRAAGWALLTALAAAIQPYLLLMVVVLLAAALLRQGLANPRALPRIALHGMLAMGAAWVALWQSGSLMVPSEQGLTLGGFGAYSTNLLALVMPTEGRSLLSPGPIPYASPLQYEGYAYLGAGVLLLVGVTAIALRRPALSWRLLPLIAALLFLALMALGPAVTAGPRTLFTYDGSWWGPLTIFRTNGRMIWPLFYGVVTAGAFAATRFGHRTALALLALSVTIQGADVAGMSRFVSEVRSHGFHDPLNSRFWRVAPPHYRRLVLVPSNLCDRNGFVDYLPFALLAGRHGLAINAGATARYDVRRAATYCEALDREVREGLRGEGTLYVVRRDLLPQVATAAAGRGTTCTEVDGFGVCFSTESQRAWTQDFEIPRGDP